MRARPSFYVQEDRVFDGWLQRKLEPWEAMAILSFLADRTGEHFPTIHLHPTGDHHICDDQHMDLLADDLRPIVLIHEWAHLMEFRGQGFGTHTALFATLVALLVEVIRHG